MTKLWRTFLAITSFISFSAMEAAETAPTVATARFSGGAAQLRVISATQVQAGRRYDARVELQLEIPPGTQSGERVELPDDLYLDNASTPVLALFVISGKNLAKTSYAWSVEGKTGRVVISDLDIGDARLRLLGVDLELVLTRVTQWETLTFQAELGRSEFFQCGPFELRATGEAQRFQVDAWAYPQFKPQHEAYRKRVPVTFIDHRFAMRQLKVFDAANRSPAGVATSVPSIGAMTSTFSNFRATDGNGWAASESEDIKYPVSMTVRLPQRFESERIKFHFDMIPLAPPPPRKR